MGSDPNGTTFSKFQYFGEEYRFAPNFEISEHMYN